MQLVQCQRCFFCLYVCACLLVWAVFSSILARANGPPLQPLSCWRPGFWPLSTVTMISSGISRRLWTEGEIWVIWLQLKVASSSSRRVELGGKCVWWGQRFKLLNHWTVVGFCLLAPLFGQFCYIFVTNFYIFLCHKATWRNSACTTTTLIENWNWKFVSHKVVKKF